MASSYKRVLVWRCLHSFLFIRMLRMFYKKGWIDLSRIPLQWASMNKWGRGSGGQFHTNHCILSNQASTWCLCLQVVLIPFFLENLAKNKIEDGFSFVLVDNFREQRNIWKGSAFFFFFRTECFKQKFVYHLLKPIFDTNFRLLQPFFDKTNWDMQMVLTILGWSLTVLIFSYHLLNLWTDRFVM